MKIYVEQEGQVRLFENSESVVHIGRGKDNELVIEEPRSSRRHCRVFETPHGYFIEDLESRNGTILNGSKVEKSVLSEGDTFEIGGTRLHFGVAPAEKPVDSDGSPNIDSTLLDDDSQERTQESREESTASLVGESDSRVDEEVFLQCSRGELEGERVVVDALPFTIGRKADNSLSLRDGRASGYHARILKRDSNYYVEDMGSKNGTHIGGRPISGETRLRRGANLVIGEHKFVVHVPKSGSSDVDAAVEISRVNMEEFTESPGTQALLVVGLLVIVSAILYFAVDVGMRIREQQQFDPNLEANKVIVNWSFEDKIEEGSKSIPGWVAGEGLSAQLRLVKNDRGVQFPGFQALGVRTTSVENGVALGSCFQDIGVLPGASYYVSGHVLNESAQGAGLVVTWLRDSSSELERRSFSEAIFEQDEGDVSSRVTAPPSARLARISCYVLAGGGAGGQAVFDRIYFGEEAPPWMGASSSDSELPAGEGDFSVETEDPGSLREIITFEASSTGRRGKVTLRAAMKPNGVLTDLHRGRTRILESVSPGQPLKNDPLRLGSRLACSVFHAQPGAGVRMSSKLPDVQNGTWVPLEINCRQGAAEIVASYIPRTEVGGGSTATSDRVTLFVQLASKRVDWRAYRSDGMMIAEEDSAEDIVELNLGKGTDLMAIHFQPAVALTIVPPVKGRAGPLMIATSGAGTEKTLGLSVRLSPISTREDSDISSRVDMVRRLIEAEKLARAHEVLEQARQAYKDKQLDALKSELQRQSDETLKKLGANLDLLKRTGASLVRENVEGWVKELLDQYGETPTARSIKSFRRNLEEHWQTTLPTNRNADVLFTRAEELMGEKHLQLAELYLNEALRVVEDVKLKQKIEHQLTIVAKRKLIVAERGLE